ncbi:MAG: iron-siderophore ABC transporter substrate-binding protein [Acidimicrobiales bacterium]
MSRQPAWDERPRLVLVSALLGVAVLAAACGDSSPSTSASTSPEEPSATEPVRGSGSTSDEVAFPVTVEHRFGATEFEAEPERVVSLGFQEHDTIFALGVEPVAVRYWYGDEDDVIFPWAEVAAGDADPEILKMPFGELNYEKIAALEPDVILGVYAGLTEEEYDTLSAIAPTVSQSADFVDFGQPWQDATRTIGTVLGRSDKAESLIAEVEDRFADVRDDHPEWGDLQLAVATLGEDGLGAFAFEDLRSRFFTELGFTVPTAIDDAAGDLFYAMLGLERADIVDTDVLVWDQVAFTPGGRPAIEAEPVLAGLDAMAEGRAVFIGEFEDAFAWNSVLSLPVALDGIVPMLERATDGDPATEPSPTSGGEG